MKQFQLRLTHVCQLKSMVKQLRLRRYSFQLRTHKQREYITETRNIAQCGLIY